MGCEYDDSAGGRQQREQWLVAGVVSCLRGGERFLENANSTVIEHFNGVCCERNHFCAMNTERDHFCQKNVVRTRKTHHRFDVHLRV